MPVYIRLLDQVSLDHWEQLSHTLVSLQWLSQVTLLAHIACRAYLNSYDLLIQTIHCGLLKANGQKSPGEHLAEVFDSLCSSRFQSCGLGALGCIKDGPRVSRDLLTFNDLLCYVCK